MRIIKRTKYLNKIINSMGTKDIKVITGVKRSGKSKLLESFIIHIKKTDNEANIIYLNLQELENEHLCDYRNLHKYVIDSFKEGFKNYVIIDEIQLCSGFEKAINSLHSKEKFDIYITSSNAFLLSSDLATLFTGRTYTIEMFPFSFEEFLAYYEYENIDNSFEKYLFEGGFAGSFDFKSIEEKYSYIDKDIYNTIIVRDLLTKNKIRNKNIMENLALYLINNVSNLTSSNNITNFLLSNNNKINHKTISNYIKYLCDAFVFYKVNRFDINGKKYLATQNKYYLCDSSIRYAKLGNKNIDYGRMYENIVAIELLRRGYEIYVGKLYKKEIDFVAIKRNEQIYIQVSRSIDDAETFKREVSPLLSIRDGYPKLVITRTNSEVYTYEGIYIYDIARWLLNEYN